MKPLPLFILLATTLMAPAASPAPNPALPTLWVVGDSTASNSAKGQQGWGDPFRDYFDAIKVNVLNRARAGRSSRTFQNEGLWDKVLAEMKAGDIVLIQMGHNDAGQLEGEKPRGSLKGIGEETKEVLTKTGEKETVHTFGWYLRKYIADTKAKGATPIILSLTVRNEWKAGKVERGSGSYGKWDAEVAKAQGVTFLDTTTIIADHYEKIGQDKVKELFPSDHTHTSPPGADLNASLVVAGLKGLSPSPVTSWLSPKGRQVAASIPNGSK